MPRTDPACTCELDGGILQANLAVKGPNRGAVSWCQRNVKALRPCRRNDKVDTASVLLDFANGLGLTNSADAKHVDEVRLREERLEQWSWLTNSGGRLTSS
jgi:hypothetical protein